jgi:hypothetical protein
MLILIPIITPLIGATIIVYRTKKLRIGIRSIKYFYIPILFFNSVYLLTSLLEYFFNPDTNGVGRLIQTMGFGMFGFLLIAVLISRFLSLNLLTRLMRTNYPFTVQDSLEYTH